MRAQSLLAFVIALAAACGGVQTSTDPTGNDPGPTTGGGGGSSPNASWLGNWSADRIDWSYSCDNGSSGGAFNENLTTLAIVDGKRANVIEVTQTDLSDPQSWEFSVAGSEAKLERTLDGTTSASEFGAHQRNAVAMGESADLKLSSGSLRVTWSVDYEANGARCSEHITGTFARRR